LLDPLKRVLAFYQRGIGCVSLSAGRRYPLFIL
jgi:hypothetical protein